jgi:TRAP-type uncharacterized transport system fused permease subunit
MATLEKIFNLVLGHPLPFTILLIFLWYLMTDDRKKLVVQIRFLMLLVIYAALLYSYPQLTARLHTVLVALGLREWLYHSADKSYQWFNGMIAMLSAAIAAAVALYITFKERKLKRRRRPDYEIKKT